MASSSVMIISPSYCSSQALEFIMVKVILKATRGNFEVHNREGNIVFKVNSPYFRIRSTRSLCGSDDVPIATLQKNMMTAHNRWEVFRGNSTEQCDLLFRVKRMIQTSIVLEVFLPSNTQEHFCDFRLEEDEAGGSYTVSVRESEEAIATITLKQGYGSYLLGKSKLAVSVAPNIDHAFIFSLISIADDIFGLIVVGQTIKTTGKLVSFGLIK